MNENKPSRGLSFGLLLLFAVILVGTGFLAFSTVRDLIVSWQVSGLAPGLFNPIDAPPTPTPVSSQIDPTVPLQELDGPDPDPWDGADRVTILVMGLDLRDWQEGQGPPRTDSMILVTIDPLTNSAGILSIPRDMWVPIPGFENGKINTAYQLGEVYELPGGGPGLAVETVEQFIGVPINFYAQIDFNAFVRIIDEIGGVKLNIPEAIEVDPMGVTSTKVISPGIQTLPGAIALAYARARNSSGGDLDRAKRQQQVILGIRDRILDFDLAPELLVKAPSLYQELSSGIKTNMTLQQAVQLGLLIQQIPETNIELAVIGFNEATLGTSPDGLDILQPIPDKIRILRDEIFTTNGPVSPAAANKSSFQLMTEEDAKIAIFNGTFTPGLAARTKNYLDIKGLDIALTDNADSAYNFTTIIDYTGNPYTLQYLIDILDLPNAQIFHSYAPDSDYDIEVNLGSDWANSGNLP